jgi:hypothetical protein
MNNNIAANAVKASEKSYKCKRNLKIFHIFCVLPYLFRCRACDIDAFKDHRQSGNVNLKTGAIRGIRNSFKRSFLQVLIPDAKPGSVPE